MVKYDKMEKVNNGFVNDRACGVMGKECLNRVAFKKMRSEQVWITSV